MHTLNHVTLQTITLRLTFIDVAQFDEVIAGINGDNCWAVARETHRFQCSVQTVTREHEGGREETQDNNKDVEPVAAHHTVPTVLVQSILH